MIGMAVGAYETHVGATRERIRSAYMGEKSAEDPFAQVRIAKAANDIDCAWLQLERDINEEMALAEADTKIPIETAPAGPRRPGDGQCAGDLRDRPALRERRRQGHQRRPAVAPVLA